MTIQRGRSALAAASEKQGSERRAYLRHAARQAARLERSTFLLARPNASLIEAGVAHLRGNAEQAVAHLAHAEQRFRDIDIAGFAQVAQYRRAKLLGGEEGAALEAEAARFFHAETVVSPARTVRMIAPGFD